MKIKKGKKPLNVAQRVEILLREGVDKPDSWMAVARFGSPAVDGVPPWTDNEAWATEFRRLYSHHLEECAFLRDVVKELCEQVRSLEEQVDARLKSNSDG